MRKTLVLTCSDGMLLHRPADLLRLNDETAENLPEAIVSPAEPKTVITYKLRRQTTLQ